MKDEDIFSVNDLIGMLNLAVIIANGKGEEMAKIPIDGALLLVERLKDLKALVET